MPIPESTLSKWSHHQAATAFKQAHVPIRKAMEEHKGCRSSRTRSSYRGRTRTTRTWEETAT